MKDFLKFVENGETLHLSATEPYSAILGEQPSKGAKSPTLWNAAFESLKISARMIPLDILPEHLENIVSGLRQDTNFIGGAVTMPYKQSICPFLDELEDEARIIGSVNCLYKRDGKLIGSNTDGAGALASIIQTLGGAERLTGKTILLLGLGGAGKAVATYLAQAVGKNGELLLANRTTKSIESLEQHLKNKCHVATSTLPPPDTFLAKADIVINCTSVGFSGARTDANGTYYLDAYTSFGDTPALLRTKTLSDKHTYVTQGKDAIVQNYEQSLKNLLKLKQSVLVYDIVYQPRQTLLLTIANSIGLSTQNGVGMNLEQAVIAFEKTIQNILTIPINKDEIRSSMEKVW